MEITIDKTITDEIITHDVDNQIYFWYDNDMIYVHTHIDNDKWLVNMHMPQKLGVHFNDVWLL